jgi:hypothetical protein
MPSIPFSHSVAGTIHEHVGHSDQGNGRHAAGFPSQCPTRRSSHQSPTNTASLRTSDVTAVSRIRGTRRTREDTRGHDDGRYRVQEDTGGNGGTRKDTTDAGFGTVRPRVQIPGPRPLSNSKVGM